MFHRTHIIVCLTSVEYILCILSFRGDFSLKKAEIEVKSVNRSRVVWKCLCRMDDCETQKCPNDHLLKSASIFLAACLWAKMLSWRCFYPAGRLANYLLKYCTLPLKYLNCSWTHQKGACGGIDDRLPTVWAAQCSSLIGRLHLHIACLLFANGK